MKSITQVVQNLLKPYIDNHDNAVAGNIAPVETDATSASQSYAVGKQLILAGVLYDVTAAITAGDALVVGTNIAVADDVVTQLASVNGALATKAALTQISNPNLIDNPWFTVNQRGQNSYTATTVSKLSFDRWKLAQNDCVISKSSDVITITTSATDYDGLLQTVERDVLKVGKTYTLSVLFSDDTIESRTFTLGSSGTSFLGAWNKNNNLDAVIVSDNNDTAWSIYVFDNRTNGSQSVSFKAVKLELGVVSTLAMDTVPNYATELLKCQRYFVRLKSSASSITFPAYVQSANGRATLQLPVAMRALPTITKTGTLEWVIEGSNNVQMSAVYAVSDDNQFIILREDNIFPSVTGYSIAILRTWTNAIVDISADL